MTKTKKQATLTDAQFTIIDQARVVDKSHTVQSGRYGWNKNSCAAMERKGFLKFKKAYTYEQYWTITDEGEEAWREAKQKIEEKEARPLLIENVMASMQDLGKDLTPGEEIDMELMVEDMDHRQLHCFSLLLGSAYRTGRDRVQERWDAESKEEGKEQRKEAKAKAKKREHKGLETLIQLDIVEVITSQAPYGEQNAIELISKLVGRSARTQSEVYDILAEYGM